MDIVFYHVKIHILSVLKQNVYACLWLRTFIVDRYDLLSLMCPLLTLLSEWSYPSETILWKS